mgnify:CR=1 FL=1
MIQISDKGLAFITAREGLAHYMYRDTRGLPTIGVGHLLTQSENTSGKLDGTNIRWSAGLTDDQIKTLLHDDLMDTENDLNVSLRAGDMLPIPYTQEQVDALISLVYNIGIGAFNASTLRKKLGKGLVKEVPKQILRWCHNHNGSVNAGLLRRRELEVDLWNGLGYGDLSVDILN